VRRPLKDDLLRDWTPVQRVDLAPAALKFAHNIVGQFCDRIKASIGTLPSRGLVRSSGDLRVMTNWRPLDAETGLTASRHLAAPHGRRMPCRSWLFRTGAQTLSQTNKGSANLKLGSEHLNARRIKKAASWLAAPNWTRLKILAQDSRRLRAVHSSETSQPVAPNFPHPSIPPLTWPQKSKQPAL